MNNQSPETVRAAAYLAARERLDFRKTTRNVKCNPPNVRCGNRCIPPTWDCRLKGEGPDPHLRAVKTDPLGGLANIERGSRRILRGVAKGSFSEVEGGKRAIIRGAVKIAPGNLQDKKELQKKLENRTRAIGIGLAVVTGGLGIHAILMRGNTFGYRSGLGRNINNATRAGVSRVLDAVPILGAQRARTRGAVGGDLATNVSRLTVAQSQGPDVLGPSAIPRVTNITQVDEDSHSKLQAGLRLVNDGARRSGTTNLTNWDERHRAAFWSAVRSEDGLGAAAPKRISVFARPSAEEYLGEQFDLPASARGSRADLKAGIEARLIEERANLLSLAKQQGFRTKSIPGGGERVHEDDFNRFVGGVVRRAPTADTRVSRSVESHVRSVLTEAPSTYTNKLYNKAVLSFDSYYKQIAQDVRRIPGAASNVTGPSMRRLTEGSDALLRNADTYRSAFLARELNIRTEILSDAHAELVRTAYYHTRVVGSSSSPFTIPDRVALTAASDLAGRAVTSRSEAIQILNREPGFQGARLNAGAGPRAGTGAQRQASLSALARQIMARQGNEGMSLEAALRQARREQRGDAAPEDGLIRAATYLALRADLRETAHQGKPCGASHIPKTHECRKGQSSTPSAASRGSQSRGKALAAGAAVTAGVGLTAAGILAYRNRTTLVPGLSQDVIRKLSADQVKAGLDKLPEQFRGPARKLVGDAKLAAAHMALRVQGAQIRAVDVNNNFSTWTRADGTHLSVGAVGDSLLTFGAERKGNIGKFPQFGLGFTINTTYDAEGGMPSGQARQLIRTTKAMYKAQLDMLPDDAFLFAVPHKADGKGAKRKSIYEGFGFKAIPGLKGDKLWALKNQGKFTEIPENQFDMLRSMIRGDSADTTENPRLGKPCGASHIPKAHECHIVSRENANRRKVAIAVAATGAVALAAALTAKHWTPAAQRILDNARPISKSNPPKGASYLAEGVSGRTWVSQDNKYLIKTPKGKFNRAKFINEVNIQNALSDAGVSVPKVHSVDAKRGIVMMDFLKDYDTLKSLPREKTAASLRTLHKEVEKMHMLGYSHGDLHSGNVLVKGADVKLIDFGNAGPVAKNGLFDINQLLLKAKGADAALYGTLVKHKSTLQSKISSGARLTQQDFLAFHEAVRKDLRSAT